MRTFLAAMIAAFQLASYIGAHAHGDDKPKRGGTMGRGDDAVSIELVMEEGVVAHHFQPFSERPRRAVTEIVTNEGDAAAVPSASASFAPASQRRSFSAMIA